MTLTEAAINVRASELASANYFDDEKLAEALRDVLYLFPDAEGEQCRRQHSNTVLLLQLFRKGQARAFLSLLEDMAAEEMVASAQRQAEREHETKLRGAA